MSRLLTETGFGLLLEDGFDLLLDTNFMPFLVRVEGEFSPGVWTSFGDDLLLPVNWKRGNESTTPKDTIAVAGSLDFTLRNDENCSGGRGYYSPNHPNCRTGFDYGLWVRVVYIISGTSYVRWTGKLRVITPTQGTYGRQVTQCFAHDSIGDLAESDILEVTPLYDEPEDVVLDALFDSLPTESQPLARNFDAGVDTIKVAFDDLGGGTKGLAAAERITTTTQGRLFVEGDGTMRYMNRDTMALQVPAYTFAPEHTILEVPTDLSNVYNRFRLTGHPKEFTPGIIVLAQQEGDLELAAGEIVDDLFLSYRDPDQPDNDIGGKDFEDPLLLGTDTVWNANPDGSGADLTNDVIVTPYFFPSAVKLVIENTAGVTAYKQTLQVRGIGILDYNPVTVQSYTPRNYGNRPMDLDFPYQDNVQTLKEQAAFLDATYRDLADQVKRITFYPQIANELMLQAMTLEIGMIVGCSDAQILPDGAYAFISAIAIDVNGEGIMICNITTAPWIVRPGLHGDVVNVDDEMTYVAAAPESRIGFGLIGLSEIG